MKINKKDESGVVYLHKKPAELYQVEKTQTSGRNVSSIQSDRIIADFYMNQEESRFFFVRR